MNRNLMLKSGLLHRIVVEFDPVDGIHNTIDIRSDGTIHYSIPSKPHGEATINSLEARDIIRNRASALFLWEEDIDGDILENSYHWKVIFYSKKGVIRTMEGWRGENQDRFTDFEIFLSELENATDEDFGAFAAEKMAHEQAEAQRIKQILQEAKELAATRSNPAVNTILRVSQKLLKITTGDLGSDQNRLISPVSIELILSLLAFASKGKTRDELLGFLGVDSDTFLDDIGALVKMVASDRATSVANAIYADTLTSPFVLPAFISKLKESGATDLLSPDINAVAINRWVNDKTKGMIPSILSPGEKLANLIVLNAIAFEAKWLEEYDDDDICDGIFYRFDGGMEKARFLNSTEDYLVYDDSAIGFLKPYQDCGFSFLGLLSQKTTNPVDFLASLPEDALGNLIRGAARVPVAVTIPEFSFDTTLDIKNLLLGEGVVSVFDENTADISNMLSLPKSYISEIKHKTHVEVDRNGTKAAALTSMFAFAGCLPELPRFEVKLDRPFVFGIVHNGSGVPLFLGVVNTLKPST